MVNRRRSSRDKIISAAFELFAQQGTTATTKDIADKADVNEVTLFRQFGSKHGLLLAVVEEAPILERMQAALATAIADTSHAEHPAVAYSRLSLALLGTVPELVRSLIGEAGQSPVETLQAIGETIRQANQQTVSYLRETDAELPEGFSYEAAASLLNTLILGRAVTDFASEGHGMWQAQNFSDVLRLLFSQDQRSLGSRAAQQVPAASVEKEIENREQTEDALPICDLPTETVRSLFQKAKKMGAQAYALTYVLFGAGLRLEEIATLTKSQSLSSKHQHLLIVTGDLPRQVPLNRWVMGNRYGSYLKNPLTQWLKSRQDNTKEIFVDEEGTALGEGGILKLWEAIAADSITITGAPPMPFNARQTWCIELLMKGISPENISILSGFSLAALECYSRRAKEKAALEAAIAIDQKN